MGIVETFTKRQKRLAGATKREILEYDRIPAEFRVQVIHLWVSAIGPFFVVDHWGMAPESNKHWQSIHDVLARERGVFELGKTNYDAFAQCQQFIQSADAGGVLDIVEVSFCRIDGAVRQQDWRMAEQSRIAQNADEAIAELNHRFLEHNLGYQFMAGKVVRLDNQFLHSEVVLPAVALLHDERFRGASQEFLRAHEHYRHGRSKEAIADALKAFESTMKTICERHKWSYDATATAQPILQLLFDKGVIPVLLQSHFTALRTTLEAGLPTVRNKTSGHGQGSSPVDIPAYLAAYAINLAAANIVLLVEADKEFGK